VSCQWITISISGLLYDDVSLSWSDTLIFFHKYSKYSLLLYCEKSFDTAHSSSKYFLADTISHTYLPSFVQSVFLSFNSISLYNLLYFLSNQSDTFIIFLFHFGGCAEFSPANSILGSGFAKGFLINPPVLFEGFFWISQKAFLK